MAIDKNITGFVYFISDGNGLIKIGVAKNPKKRVKELQTASPKKLRVVSTVESENPFALEKKLHKEFDKLRLNGEWFAMDDTHARAIADGLNKKLCDHCGNPPFHYYGVNSDWFAMNANFATLINCPAHLAFYDGNPNYEPGMEIIEDMTVVHRVILQMTKANKSKVSEG